MAHVCMYACTAPLTTLSFSREIVPMNAANTHQSRRIPAAFRRIHTASRYPLAHAPCSMPTMPTMATMLGGVEALRPAKGPARTGSLTRGRTRTNEDERGRRRRGLCACRPMSPNVAQSLANVSSNDNNNDNNNTNVGWLAGSSSRVSVRGRGCISDVHKSPSRKAKSQ